MRALSWLIHRRLAGVALAIITVSSPLAGQFVFEARQGTTWGDKLVLSQLGTMTFRWKWDGREEPNEAGWQMTFDTPGPKTIPAIVKSAGVSVPTATRLSEYGTFQIGPDAVPANAPETFYVRMQTGRTYSAWIPVTITGVTRASNPLAPPPLITSGVAAPTLVTEGVHDENAVWMKLTKLICHVETADGAGSDEAYAIVASVAIDWSRPWASPVHVANTRLMQLIDDKEERDLDVAVWGPPDGYAAPLKNPKGAVILVALYEQDGGDPLLVGLMAKAKLVKAVSGLNPELSYSAVSSLLREAFSDGVQAAAGGGDFDGDEMIGMAQVQLEADEIADAKAGKVIKKELQFGGGSRGSYSLRFQLSRGGVSPVVW